MKQTFKIGHAEFGINNLRAFLIIVILCFGAYGNTIYNDYNLDDPIVVTSNNFVKKGFAGIPEIISNPYQDVYGNKSDYRPLSEITLAVEYQFFGLNPHVSHLVNILFYILLVWLLYQLLLCFKLNEPYPFLPLLITCFFIVHTAHTEVVASIKNREEILALLFGLASLLCVFHYYSDEKRKALNLTGAIAFMLLSLISKVSAAPLMGVIFLMAYQFGPRFTRTKQALLIPVAFIAGIILATFFKIPPVIAYLGLPAAVMYVYRDNRKIWSTAYLLYLLFISTSLYMDFHHNLGSRQPIGLENPLKVDHQFFDSVAISLDSLWFYFKFQFFPYPSRFYYGAGSIPLHELTDGVLILSFLVHTVFFAYGCYSLWHRRLIGVVIIAYFMCIFSYSNLFFRYPGIVSERGLFLPGLWFMVAIFMMLFNVFKTTSKKKLVTNVPGYVWVCITGLFFLYSVLTVQRNMEWKDYLTLASADIDDRKNWTLTNRDYADLLRNAGEAQGNVKLRKKYLDKAKFYYNHTIGLSPKYAFPYYGMGEILRYDDGLVDSACNYFYTAYIIDSSLTMVQFQIARCAFEKGAYPEARRLLGNLYAQMPQDTFVVYYYAKALYVTGDHEGARRVNATLIKINPTSINYFVNEGYFYNLEGNIPVAAENFEKAVNNGCRDNDIFNFLLNYYLSHGQEKKANDLKNYFGGGK